jgi:hypothetical protein
VFSNSLKERKKSLKKNQHQCTENRSVLLKKDSIGINLGKIKSVKLNLEN